MTSIGLGRPAQRSTRHPRHSSGQYTAVFEPSQLQTFKEAFNFFDQDGDGWLTAQDLTGLLTSLGEKATPDRISALLSARPTTGDPAYLSPNDNRINFTMFVTMMSEQLSTLDPESELLEAFASFDDAGKGVIKPDELRKCLKTEGNVMSDDEIDRLLSPPFVDNLGRFRYRLFCETLRVTDQEV